MKNSLKIFITFMLIQLVVVAWMVMPTVEIVPLVYFPLDMMAVMVGTVVFIIWNS